MPRTFCLLTFLFLFSTTLSAQTIDDLAMKEIRLKQLELRNSQDSSTWYVEKMELDLNSDTEGYVMNYGVYPYPRYDLLGKFKGLGVGGRAGVRYPIELNGKQIVYTFFDMNPSPFYPEIKKDRQVFFTIITVADTNAENYYAPSRVVSRNHPDYLGEGVIRSGETEIDYMVLTTPDNGSMAIVNQRIFDLKYGNIVLIAPQEDGTLRSLQLKEAPLHINEDAQSFEELVFDNFIREDLLSREAVIDFFTNDEVK
jgi:hypothetical protein